jgi:hypothetical protein
MWPAQNELLFAQENQQSKRKKGAFQRKKQQAMPMRLLPTAGRQFRRVRRRLASKLG